MNLRGLTLPLPRLELLDPPIKIKDPAHERLRTVITVAPYLWDFVLVDGIHHYL